jgi:hypothetical protein
MTSFSFKNFFEQDTCYDSTSSQKSNPQATANLLLIQGFMNGAVVITTRIVVLMKGRIAQGMAPLFFSSALST